MKERDEIYQPTNPTEHEGLTQTRWWIVTGGPGTGKTTLVNFLARCGYQTMSEAARGLIDEELAQGKSIEEIRADEVAFQLAVLRRKKLREDEVPTDKTVIWDRGLVGDSIAYWLLNPVGASNAYSNPEIIVLTHCHRGVFLLNTPPYKQDNARVEDEKRAAQIHFLIGWAYRQLGYEPIRVPVMSVEERARFVIARMREVDPTVPDLPLPPRLF